MLNNYYVDEFGIIHQKETTPFFRVYAHDYNSHGVKSNYISYLRLGYIFGTIQNAKDCTSILDVGFGNGDFLRASQNCFDVCAGNDLIYDYLPEGCVKQEDITKKYYDIITFYDSLEHFNDINIIKELNCRYIIVSVPNCKNGENDSWFESWKHRKPNEHLHHFNKNSLSAFMKHSGYKVLNTSYVEDVIRKSSESENILTIACEKI